MLKMASRPSLAVSRGLVALSSRSNARNSSHYKPPAHWYPPTMNELPSPQGSWQAQYDAQQKKYNLQLIGGVTFFVATLGYLKMNGPFLNADIPR